MNGGHTRCAAQARGHEAVEVAVHEVGVDDIGSKRSGFSRRRRATATGFTSGPARMATASTPRSRSAAVNRSPPAASSTQMRTS